LNSLVARALAANPDLLQATSRIRQVRARQKMTRAAATPSIDGTLQAGYTRISEHAIPSLPGSEGQPGEEPSFGLPGMDFTTFRAGFDASWEADLFGGQGAERAAAAERLDAALWSARDVQVTLAAEIGDTYLRYRAAQQRFAIAETLHASEREMLSFVEARARNGLEQSTAVRAQERQLAAAAAALESARLEQDLLLHALGVLIGDAPNALAEELAAPQPMPTAGLNIPVGLPSDLLLRRPDLRAAERQLAAATSDIGAARADLFPKITLTGALQLVSTSLATLLSPASLQANSAAGLSIPLLDGGRRRANLDLRRAQAEEAGQAYRGQVLVALRDVEDALTRLDANRQRQEFLAASERAAADAADTLDVRYRNGLVPFTEVIEARQKLLDAQNVSLDARAATAADVISLYKALGGGWDMEVPKNG
jgi:NodT family efflux transporter outer membrane factor (OMF) lipoprotein